MDDPDRTAVTINIGGYEAADVRRMGRQNECGAAPKSSRRSGIVSERSTEGFGRNCAWALSESNARIDAAVLEQVAPRVGVT